MIYIFCKVKINRRVVRDYPAPATAPPPPAPPFHHEFPMAQAPQLPWTTQTAHGPPYTPYQYN
jgi:hypothetical protein